MIVDTVTNNMNMWFSRNSYEFVTSGRANQEGASPLSLFVAFDVIDEHDWEDLLEDILDARDAMEDYQKLGLSDTTSYFEYREERRAGGG